MAVLDVEFLAKQIANYNGITRINEYTEDQIHNVHQELILTLNKMCRLGNNELENIANTSNLWVKECAKHLLFVQTSN